MPNDSKTVLVVDDQAFMRTLVSARLELRGYRILQASNGEEAYARVQEQTPDLIICDVLMPGGDGLTFCRRLREEGKKIPFLFLSSVGQSDKVVEGFATGADDYLTKPFDVKVLEARVNVLLRRRPGE